MEWKEACLESEISVAVRESKDHIYYRFKDGFSYCDRKSTNFRRVASVDEVEGFHDWESL
jgi:hypothetical protein